MKKVVFGLGLLSLVVLLIFSCKSHETTSTQPPITSYNAYGDTCGVAEELEIQDSSECYVVLHKQIDDSMYLPSGGLTCNNVSSGGDVFFKTPDHSADFASIEVKATASANVQLYISEDSCYNIMTCTNSSEVGYYKMTGPETHYIVLAAQGNSSLQAPLEITATLYRSSLWYKSFASSYNDYISSLKTCPSSEYLALGGYTYGNLVGSNPSAYAVGFVYKMNLSDGETASGWPKAVADADHSSYVMGVATTPDAILAIGHEYVQDSVSGSWTTDIFVVKFNSDGSQAWKVNISTPTAYDYGSAIVTDLNDVYITGYSYGNIGGSANNGGADIYIAKLSMADGSVQWQTLIGSPSDDIPTSMAIEGTSYIYVAGYTLGNIDSETNKGSYDVFVAKYSLDGTKSWVKLFGGNLDDYALSVAVAPSSQAIYVAGYSGSPNVGAATNIGYYDGLIMKLTTAGSLSWAKMIGTPNSDYLTGVDVNSTEDKIFVSGYTYGNWNGINLGAADMVLIRMDADGNVRWTKLWGSTRDDYLLDISYANEKIFTAGHTAGNVGDTSNLGGFDTLVYSLCAIP